MNLTFPEDYGNKEMAGAKTVFEVLLKQVNEVKTPAIDDELAKKTGAFEKLEDLRKDIRKNLEEQAQKQADDQYKDRLLAKLVEVSETEAPKTLVQEQVEAMRGDLLRNLKARKMELEDWLKAQGKKKDEWEKDIREAAERRVISSIVVQRLGEEMKVEISDKDIEDQLEQMRQAYAKSPEALKEIDDPRTKANIYNRLRIEAIMDKLVGINKPKAKVVDVKKADKKAKKSDKKTEKKADKKAKKSK